MNTQNELKKTDRLASLDVAPGSALSSRELEILQLEIAISKTKAAQQRADATSFALHEKLAGQEAEMRFQKLMRRFSLPNVPGQTCGASAPKQKDGD